MNPTKKPYLFFRNIMNKIRRLRFKHKKKKLINNDVTILCNTCLAGVIYSSLSLQFLSPTINLELDPESFLNYVSNIDNYKNGKFIDRHQKLGYYFGPHAYLSAENLPNLNIVFTHYTNFDMAIAKWKEREKRINKSKIFILYEARFQSQIDLIDKINNLPYPKVILSNLPSNKNRNILHMDWYEKNPSKPITSFINIFGKRGIDEFDYITTIFNRDYKING